jgi:DNA-binding NarL/FixJ family response regulator
MIAPSKKGERDFRPLKVLLVSDFPLMRMGMVKLLAQTPGFEVAGECGSAEEALDAVRRRKLDIVVLDLSLRTSLGLELVRDLKAADGKLRILVTSVHEDTLYAGMALSAGAMAYVNKNIAPQEVLNALHELANGQIFLSPHIAQRMLGKVAGLPAADGNMNPLDGLSERELEIFEMIGKGWTTRRIAHHLSISVHTVETYRERLRTKLGIKNSVELSFRAIVWVLMNG